MSRFVVDEAEGTVRDSYSNLVWKRASEPGKYTLLEARDYVSKVGDGWRLPTKEELKGLVDKKARPTVDIAIFPDTTPDPYWSSSPVESDDGVTWTFDFGHGYAYDRAAWTDKARVRLVRG
jgi:hypothetical protein